MSVAQPVRFVPNMTVLEDRTTPATLTPDPGFGIGGKLTLDLGSNDMANAVAIQPDGKIVIAGTSGPDGDFAVARINPNGTLDSSFDGDGVRYIDFNGRADVATDLVILSNGTILVGGTSTKVAGDSDFAIVRLNADGSNDSSFAGTGQRRVSIGPNDTANDLMVSSFGTIYLGGTSDGNFAVVRLDPFGVVDKGYGSNGGQIVDLGGNDVATSINLLNDGRLYISGYTNAANPDSASNDFVGVRLSADGTLVDFGYGNTTLNGNKAALIDLGGDDQSYSATITPDGGLLLAGTNGGDDANFALVQLTPAGLPDPMFNDDGIAVFSVGNQDKAMAVLTQHDGRILVAGSTSEGSGAANVAVIRLTSSGALDTSPGSSRILDFGGNDQSFAIALDASRRVILAGQTSDNIGVVRLGAEPGIDRLLLASGTLDGSALQYNPNSAGQFAKGAVVNVFPGFTGTIRVATADLNGDGVTDQIAGAGPGTGSVVAAYDGATGKLLANFFAFEPTFTGGVLIDAGDFNGDGLADIVVTADIGGGPRVRVFDGAKISINSPTIIADFFGIADPNFRGGSRAAVGDLNADGRADLLVMAGPNGGPRVSIYDGQSIAAGTPRNLIPDFFAFEPSLRDGAYATIGDFNQDGFGDIVFGAGLGGSPRVRIINGQTLLQAEGFTLLDQLPGVQLASFMAGDSNSRSGVRVAVKDVDSDGIVDLVTGSGPNQPSGIRVYRTADILAAPTDPTPLQVLNPFSGTLPEGVFVG